MRTEFNMQRVAEALGWSKAATKPDCSDIDSITYVRPGAGQFADICRSEAAVARSTGNVCLIVQIDDDNNVLEWAVIGRTQ